MPDITTHLLIGLSIAILLGKEKDKEQLIIILLGSIIIDAERPLTWLLENSDFYWIGLTGGFHSFLGAILLSGFVALIIDSERVNRSMRFKLALLGAISHLIIDLTMYPWVEMGIYLLYPLKVPLSLNLFWPDFWWYPLIGGIVLLCSILIRNGISYSQQSN